MNISTFHRYHGQRSSSALILVLFAVVLVTLMVVALMSGARLERQATFYYVERMRADALAQGGIDQAVGLLRNLAGGTDGTNVLAAIGPGKIMDYYVTNGSITSAGPFDLSSGTAPTSDTGVWAPPNLNQQMLDGTYPLQGSGVAMPVRWIYVYRDGTYSVTDPPAVNAANPLVGRYAFWIDNASCRINLNTAWTHTTANTNAVGDASRVALDTSPDFSTNLAADTHAYATSANPFNTDYDLRTNEITSAVSSNRYDYTFYNHSSDGVNPFGQPKIYLTTQIANLPPGFTNVPGYTNYYLHILNNDSGNQLAPGNDPGVAANLNDAYITATVQNIYAYMGVNNWPEWGQPFTQKYWNGANQWDDRGFQLAVNILEYVRAKESRQKIVNAIRGQVNQTYPNWTFQSTTVADQSEVAGAPAGSAVHNGYQVSLLGVTRTPLISEVGAYFVTNSGIPSFDFQTEIYLPPHAGIDSLSGSDFYMSRKFWYSNTNFPSGNENRLVTTGDLYYNTNVVASGTNQFSFWVTKGSLPLSPGQYAEVEGVQQSTTNSSGVYGLAGLPPTTLYAWQSIYPAAQALASTNAEYNAWSWAAPLNWGENGWGTSPGATTNYGIGPFTLTAANYNTPLSSSFQVNDPLLGLVATNWVYLPSTWGGANRNDSRGTAPIIGFYTDSPPQQDTDGAGLITDIGWQIPYPYGYVTASGLVPNPTGRVNSLAELGQISTGAVSWLTLGYPNGGNGVPWRTLRLQPQTGFYNTPKHVPDWALLDVFALPTASTNFFSRPYTWTNGASVYVANGGRVNLNSYLTPFPSGSTNVARIDQLVALFSGATNPISGTTLPYSTATNISTSIVAGYLSGAGAGSGTNTVWLTGRTYDSYIGVLMHVGEICEMANVSDGGEATEGNLYEPFSQATTGGNVFTIYTIGQALQQTPSGNILVNGEKRYQATIERVPAVSSAVPNQPGLFRTIVMRELSQ